MRIKQELVSQPLAKVLESRKWEPTDTLFFCDDTMGQRVVGYSYVPLEYFANNPRPNGLLEDNMVVRGIGWGKNHHEKIIQSVSGFISQHYEEAKETGENVVAFVLCNAFHEKHVKKALKDMKYDPDRMPSVINVLGHKTIVQGNVLNMEPRDYWYKQQVGDYAMNLYQNKLKNHPKCKNRRIYIE